MTTYYTFMGAFTPLRRIMNQEFRRVGITHAKDKYAYFNKVIGKAPRIKNMTISQLNEVIQSLQQVENNVV